MSDIVITVNNLSKMYKLYENSVDRLKESFHPFRKKYHRDFFALNNISFEVKKGESVGIIGKNGSGKSTFLKILTGVLTPTSGAVTVKGKVSALLELGAAFNPELTGIENVYFSGSIMGYTKKEMDNKIDDILAFADIGEFVHQPVKMYSSGMFIRLAFANAISVDPDILIVDEALSVGDIFFQQKCHARMEKLIQTGVTIIVVSHDMQAIEKYSNKVLLLNQGKCAFMGHPTEAIHRYYSLLYNNSSIADATVATISKVQNETHDSSEKNVTIQDWPNADAFLDMSNAIVIGQDAIVECTGIAVCDESGRSCTSFQIGETAVFFVEFKALMNIPVPLCGVELVNSKNLVIHSKSSLHYLVDAPPMVEGGQKIRFKQTMKMQLAPGDYTVVIAFATIKAEDYHQAEQMNAEQLYSKIRHALRVTRLIKITIREKDHGLSLQFYGLVDLQGSANCEVLPRST